MQKVNKNRNWVFENKSRLTNSSRWWTSSWPFTNKVSAFKSWFKNAEEDVTDPGPSNTLEEIKSPSVGPGCFPSLAQLDPGWLQRADQARPSDQELLSSFQYRKGGGAVEGPAVAAEEWQGASGVHAAHQRLLPGDQDQEYTSSLMIPAWWKNPGPWSLSWKRTNISTRRSTPCGTSSWRLKTWVQLWRRAYPGQIQWSQHRGSEEAEELVLPIGCVYAAHTTTGVTEEALKEFSMMCRHFDKCFKLGHLNQQDFKSCLCSLGSLILSSRPAWAL